MQAGHPFRSSNCRMIGLRRLAALLLFALRALAASASAQTPDPPPAAPQLPEGQPPVVPAASPQSRARPAITIPRVSAPPDLDDYLTSDGPGAGVPAGVHVGDFLQRQPGDLV